MNGKTNDLKLLEPPSPEWLLPDSGFSQWWIVAGVALLVLLAVLVIIWRRKSPAVTPLALRHAAHTEAVTAFSNISAADVREAAIQSSLILRRYLSAAAGDPALFETHEEFISRHDALLRLTEETRLAASTGFTRLATLKYAPEIRTAAAAEEVIRESRTLLETLHHGFTA
jgi:hypothetical protein